MPIRRGRSVSRADRRRRAGRRGARGGGVSPPTTGGGARSRPATLRRSVPKPIRPHRPRRRTSARAAAAVPPTKVLLLGDSVAATMGVGFADVGDRDNSGGVEPRSARLRLFYSGATSTWPASSPPAARRVTTGHGAGSSLWTTSTPTSSCCWLAAWDVLDRQINGQWLDSGASSTTAISSPSSTKPRRCSPPAARRSSS